MSDAVTIRDVRAVAPVTAAELLAMDLPPREMLFDPVIPTSGLVLLYGPRGMGKTYVALSIAYAVASGGGALRWQAPKPRRVLYLDGEMPAATLKERLRALVLANDRRPPDDEFLRFLPADLFELGLPNIASEEGRALIKRCSADVDLVILDNLSCLASGMRENEADDWQPMQDVLLSLRRAGVAVLTVHHAGKGGQQRGTSRREDVMDTVIALRRPGDYEPQQGARFAVHLEKARGITGDGAIPFEARLTEAEGGGLAWVVADLATAQRDRALTLLAEGLSLRDVAEETGLSKSAVHRIKRANGADDARH
ncbi:AAA family ATPase [Elioraea rosea]|uniref:AAA family ATPase n=1 Tax=Elioraea rosea TaxID=2492390 RepID=UPI0011824EC9|nr:AAA family ATPase [Elioraea rosea]